MLQKSLLKYCLELLCLQDKDKNKELIQGHEAWLQQETLALCGGCTAQLKLIKNINFVMVYSWFPSGTEIMILTFCFFVFIVCLSYGVQVNFSKSMDSDLQDISTILLHMFK